MDFDSRSPVVVLAGGTGGAKLARGMADVAGDDLVVIANTGDDVELYGAYVAPDPDLVTFWLADRIDERGWGLAGDTFAVMDGLRELGVDVWFNLGDRDLAYGVRRAELLAGGARLTEAIAELTAALGRRRHRPAHGRRARPHERAQRRPLGAVSGVHGARARGPADRRRALRRHRRGDRRRPRRWRPSPQRGPSSWDPPTR